MSVPPAAPARSAITSSPVRRRALAVDRLLRLKDQLSEDELALLLKARAFVDDEVLPVIGGFWKRAEFPRELPSGWASWGSLGTASPVRAARR